MARSDLLDDLGITYNEESPPRQDAAGLLGDVGLMVPYDAPAESVPGDSEAKNFFQKSMGIAKDSAKGFFERNDILPTLADTMKVSFNILRSGGPFTKEVQINDPVRKEHLERWRNEGIQITPTEHFNYTRSGILPSSVVEKITDEREQAEALIESQGGQLRVIADAIQQHPGEMALEMGKYIVSNPQYLMLPMAYATVAARMGRTAGVAAETAAGAGLAAGGAALVTRQQEGMVDPKEVQNAAIVGGGAGLLVGTGQAVMSTLKRAGDLVQSKTGIQSADIQAQIVRYSQKHKVSMQVAASRVMEINGVDPYPIVEELNKVASKLEDNLIPDGPKHGPKTRRQQAIEKTIRKPEVERGLDEITSQAPPPEWVESRSNIDVPPTPSRERGADPAAAMFTSAAYRPNKGAVTEPLLTMQEFADSPMGLSKSGKRLGGAALRSRYEKFHREMIEANKDPDRVVTLQEMQEIMEETSPTMKAFFQTQARKLDKKLTDLPPSVKKARKQAGLTGQRGAVDPRLVAFASATGIAALVGYAKEHDPETAIRYAAYVGGGLLGLRVLRGWLKGRNEIVDRILSPPLSKLDLDKLYAKWQGEGAIRERRILNLRNSLYELSGGRRAGKKMREEITDALEAGDLSKLDPVAQGIARTVREEFDKIGKEIVQKGFIEESDLLENYVAHMWQHPTRSVTETIDAMFEDMPRGLATKSMHQERRVIPTYQAGQKAGLTPKTKDIADILAMYQKSVDHAQRNQELFNSLRYIKDPLTDKPLVIKGVENAPKSYRTVNHPRFSGHAVHPDLAPVVKSIFNVNDFSAPVRGVMGLNFFLKRMAVSLSAFHAKALMFSALMAGGMEKAITSPVNSTSNLIKTLGGKSPHLEMFRKGPVGDAIDEGLRNGLILNTVDDVGSDTFFQSLDTIKAALDKTAEAVGPILGSPFSVAGKAVAGNWRFSLKNVNLWTDGMMWDRIYTGFKISTYLDKMQKLESRYAHKIPRDTLSKYAAEFTNDAFGGLNWLRLAENVNNRYGRQLAYHLVSKPGRAQMQLLGFAPDWTTANVRVFYKAFFNKSAAQRRLYQMYQFRGMLMFLLMANVANNMLAGHNLWENKDPTTIELGDGTRMVLSKQFMEPTKWLLKTEQEALNKTSTMLSTTLQLLTGKKWLTGPGQYAPPIENRLTHVLSKATPIWAQQAMAQKSIAAGAKSLAGFPTYGTPQGSAGIQSEAPDAIFGGTGKNKVSFAPGDGPSVFSGLARTASGMMAKINPMSPPNPLIDVETSPMPENMRQGLRNAPRGIANNNPLNIEQGANWQGLSRDQSKDPRFAQFDDPRYGVRAAVKIMQNYNRRGVNTLSGIINTWAPPTENNTKAYIDTVSKLSGIGKRATIDTNDEAMMVKLLRAMVAVENGHKYGDFYSDETLRQGIRMAQ